MTEVLRNDRNLDEHLRTAKPYIPDVPTIGEEILLCAPGGVAVSFKVLGIRNLISFDPTGNEKLISDVVIQSGKTQPQIIPMERFLAGRTHSDGFDIVRAIKPAILGRSTR